MDEEVEILKKEYNILEVEFYDLQYAYDKLQKEFDDMEDYVLTLEEDHKTQGNELGACGIAWSKLKEENERLKEENEELMKPFERFDLLDL